MAQITLKGNSIHTVGELPEVGGKAPEFILTKTDLSDVQLKDFVGKKVILNIFPSIDTPVCATSVRKFNAEASKMENAVVLCISADLPFAHARFCGAEGLNNVLSLSTFRYPAFGKDYGLEIVDGPMKGLLSRVVIIIDEKGVICYKEQVPEIGQEPDYANAIKML